MRARFPIFTFISLMTSMALAYPDFVAYGYKSCMTCHFNGLGGGALTDYGRALFATEITSRFVFPKETDEENIAGLSGFLWGRDLPWWFRPGLKYRGLWLQNSPGSGARQERSVTMQAELNLNFLFDEEGKYALISSLASSDRPRRWATGSETEAPGIFWREVYLRWQAGAETWVSLGQMDKVFGVRLEDHTLNSRTQSGIGALDQSVGFIVQHIQPEWELAANIFAGNMDQKVEERESGLSLLGELDVSEDSRIGASVMTSSTPGTEWKRLALFSKSRVSAGTSLIYETGLVERRLKSSSNEPPLLFYNMLRALVKLSRGYNLLTQIEQTRSDVRQDSLDAYRWSFGFLTFPLPRTEARLTAVTGRNVRPDVGGPEAWALQGQVHVSW